ncbi:hypothetical protein AG0111_0g3840 [Alternaria gaisen]|uniref:Uncharacterized protein n=1 Tax=Alternaria gaisen TaxID=167740 RepID=A0ACB6FU51_9PLEO|nr:hypothetical protein AG0111_0g3840 [Alternaria gaisen]
MATQGARGPFPTPFEMDISVLRDADEAGEEAVSQTPQDLMRLIPASIRSKKLFELQGRQHRGMDVIERAEVTPDFLEKELSVPRLNYVHDFLWLAGRPMPPRALNYQVASSRAITVTEDINLHLVWESGRIFLKPLPRYLLSSTFWRKYLLCQDPQGSRRCSCFTNPDPQLANPVQKTDAQCNKRELYKCAYGFLLSYTALVQYESDYLIARNLNLLPGGVKWRSWCELSRELLEYSPHNTARVNKRYQFGELRLSRLNKIYRVKGLSLIWSGSRNRGLEHLMRGYKFEFATYGQQFAGYLAPILAATAYIALVLTAMQVGLGTDTLRESAPFHRASYGFTVFSILTPLILVVIAAFVVLLFVPFNYFSTKNYFRERMAFYAYLGM